MAETLQKFRCELTRYTFRGKRRDGNNNSTLQVLFQMTTENINQTILGLNEVKYIVKNKKNS